MYVKPIVIRFGTFRELTQTGGHEHDMTDPLNCRSGGDDHEDHDDDNERRGNLLGHGSSCY